MYVGRPKHRFTRSGAFASLLIVCTLIATVFASPTATKAQDCAPPSTVWVDGTGHTLDGIFLDDWRSYQDLYGAPLTEELRQKHTLADGKEREYITQYFENIAIAYVPKDKRDGWKVQALPLGVDALKNDQKKLADLK